MAEIILINPRFDESYWGMDNSLSLFDKRASLPVASLPLLAALTSAEHTVTILDENIDPLDLDRVAQADIVGVTGMNVQYKHMAKLIEELKSRGAFVVVGGAWISVEEDAFESLPDVIFVGEAEETWPRFLEDWKQGRHQPRYQQDEPTDMTRVPPPRFDLLNMKDYMFGSVQVSRGCPFQCEFCDIIVTFGRRPRLKTSAQVLAELENLRKHRMRFVFVVDDNLIGNKKAIKVLLRDIIAWQRAHGFPLVLSTQASLDLADDPELLELMTDANFINVFIGIESPNEASLRETKKLQNVRKGRSMVERVHAIQMAGLEVWCGMIVGFDNDDLSIFDAHRRFIREARITQAMLGLLHALPKTPLYARLKAEGRLDLSEDLEQKYGTNVIPLQMTRDELREGLIQLLNDVYEPQAYFDRLEDLYIRQQFPYAKGRSRWWWRRPWSIVATHSWNLLQALVLYRRLMRHVSDPALRREYRRRVGRFLRARWNPALLLVLLVKCVMHHHHYTAARKLTEGLTPVNTF